MDENISAQTLQKRILVVDDDMFIRELYEEVLKSEGFQVETAEDGEVGLQKLRTGGYNVVLLDVMMPKRDGIGVLSQLQSTPPTKENGAIILLTNLGHDSVIKEAISLGAVTYLNKADMTPDQLVDHVKKYLH